jgi:hypothetical protein
MTPKEKAKELVYKYYELGTTANNYLNFDRAKNYAIVAVEFSILFSDFHLEFLQEVKEEIENLKLKTEL